MKHMKPERSLVLIKPDAIKKSIIGKIINRLEETGLKMVGCKMVWVDKEFAKNHYAFDEKWAKKAFEKTLLSYQKMKKPMPYKSYKKLGKTIQKWNMNFITEGPVIAIIWQGHHAVEIIRKIVGLTEPMQSPPGTIRGDFASIESYDLANPKNRALRNLIHASDSTKNAKREIALWFDAEEIHSDYKILNDYLVE